jgi:hypothetical protein
MTHSTRRHNRWTPTVVLATIALAGATLVGTDVASEAASPVASSAIHMSGSHNSQKAALREAMRALWEQHMEWTYSTVAAFAAGTPGLNASLNRLLRNQNDIGDAIKPYYGDKAGNALAKLLRKHITDAVPVLTAARSGDTAGLESAVAAWHANAKQLADFLAAANPHWGKAEMEKMMSTHIDQTVAYAAAQLEGHYARSIRLYGHAENHMLHMADMLSNGIIAQFPSRF